MPSEIDQFDDVITQQRGIFGADAPGMTPALSEHEAQRKVPGPEGVSVQFECARCGGRRLMMVEWPELIALRFGVPPAIAYQRAPHGLLRGAPLDWKWDANEQVWWPSMPCSNCRSALLVWLTPQEIQQSTDLARSRGFIPPQMEQVCGQLCTGAAQALRAQMGR